MTLQADKNLYPGINIHLNSLLQNEPGGWESFHVEQIVELSRFIDTALPDNFVCHIEASLQLRVDEEYGIEALNSIIIYQSDSDKILSQPLTHIELLSPSNKPGGLHFENYKRQRLQTMEGGLNLVEIDFLHQSPPVIHGLPDYSKGEKSACAFAIFVSNPQPTLQSGTVSIYSFGVDDQLPIINIPLVGTDVVKVDFGTAYNRTFESSRFFRLVVDYEREPVQFERYTPADRERIQQRLAAIRGNS